VIRLAFLFAAVLCAQPKVGVLHVQGNVYLIHGAGPNIAMQVGEQAVVLVDSGPANMSEAIRAAIRTVSNKPIGFIVNTSYGRDRTGGNGNLKTGGFYMLTSANEQRAEAAMVAHQSVLDRMTELDAPGPDMPRDTYDEPSWKLFANNEPVILEHLPNAHSDGDSLVFFRRSDVVALGEIYDANRYPVIDEKAGGSLNGILKALNHVLRDIAVAKENEEGGTYIIPGRGHIADRNDLANYRDMLTVIRDRIQDAVKKGRTLEQVKASRPTFDYDGGFGADSGPWTTNMFIEAVYRELSRKGK
jgi:glyoxylase-like metal-dependent hydrolase (beta-lactamase superfamily II)